MQSFIPCNFGMTFFWFVFFFPWEIEGDKKSEQNITILISKEEQIMSNNL